jgi:hypothetical protein
MLFSCSVRYRANDSNPFFRHPLRSDSHARARSGSEKIPRRSSASLSSRVAENRRSALHRLFLPTSQVASLVHPSSLSGTRCGSYISRACANAVQKFTKASLPRLVRVSFRLHKETGAQTCGTFETAGCPTRWYMGGAPVVYGPAAPSNLMVSHR